jgi:hypothetical protein
VLARHLRRRDGAHLTDRQARQQLTELKIRLRARRVDEHKPLFAQTAEHIKLPEPRGGLNDDGVGSVHWLT